MPTWSGSWHDGEVVFEVAHGYGEYLFITDTHEPTEQRVEDMIERVKI